MNYYLLTETMKPCTEKEMLEQSSAQYVAVLSSKEWARER